jgi:hypothetical protein
VPVTSASNATHAPFFTINILPSFNVIKLSFKAGWVAAAEESVAAGAGALVAAAVSVVEVDDLGASLHANVRLAMATVNNSFFMMCNFLVLLYSNLRYLFNLLTMYIIFFVYSSDALSL